ncbi:hypothetical protein [Vibrio nigripulchritudo]|uniref:hypothetical protein n=1 Tax=Vibrio nigripulchritudo TaxID=28173 RepID=UPI0024914DA4|nr:hypothetical protein [Vibrio nigripulchritudo]BDU37129.1 hypothetical protein TUMSATVNIG2_15980 [Vibrio nigripulchritudo]BDU42841.1 hypothetical protein TUMSATVNIG3_16390 [Vibrio nigripulchritudo]
MILRALLISFMFSGISGAAIADDSHTNKVAEKIKKRVERSIKRYRKPLQGYCNYMIEMEHKGKYAYIKRIRYAGDKKICKVGKKGLKKGMRFKYKVPEMYIRIHVSE